MAFSIAVFAVAGWAATAAGGPRSGAGIVLMLVAAGYAALIVLSIAIAWIWSEAAGARVRQYSVASGEDVVRSYVSDQLRGASAELRVTFPEPAPFRSSRCFVAFMPRGIEIRTAMSPSTAVLLVEWNQVIGVSAGTATRTAVTAQQRVTYRYNAVVLRVRREGRDVDLPLIAVGRLSEQNAFLDRFLEHVPVSA